ncbi:MAG: metalloregulator ArsR/SmtB family transcription factor [Thermoproteota archaeon]
MKNSSKKRNDLDIARVKIFKALADPMRLKILCFLKDGEKYVTEMIPFLKTVQPLISRHLKVLRECGLVSCRKEGNKRPYWVTDRRIFEIINMVGEDFIESISKYAEEKLL